jgi:hypothetical protein
MMYYLILKTNLELDLADDTPMKLVRSLCSEGEGGEEQGRMKRVCNLFRWAKRNARKTQEFILCS